MQQSVTKISMFHLKRNKNNTIFDIFLLKKEILQKRMKTKRKWKNNNKKEEKRQKIERLRRNEANSIKIENSLPPSYHDLYHLTYMNRQRDDTYQSWSIKSYDCGLIAERLMSQRHWKEQGIQDPRPPESNYEDDDQTTRPNFNRVLQDTNRSKREPLTGHRKQSTSPSGSCKCCVIFGQQWIWIGIETKLKGIAYKSYKIEERTNNDKFTKLSPRIFEQIIAGIIIDKIFIFCSKLRYLYYGMGSQ